MVRLLARVHALQSFITTDDGVNLLAGYKRAVGLLPKDTGGNMSKTAAANILIDGHAPPPKPQAKEAEAALIAALETAEHLAAQAVADERFEDAMAALATLRAPIDTFFDNVTVNDPDPDERKARLHLLARVRDAVHSVADFSKITG